MQSLKFTLKVVIYPLFATLACASVLFALIEVAAKHMGELCVAGIAWLGRGGK